MLESCLCVEVIAYLYKVTQLHGWKKFQDLCVG